MRPFLFLSGSINAKPVRQRQNIMHAQISKPSCTGYLATPFGVLGIETAHNKLYSVDFLSGSDRVGSWAGDNFSQQVIEALQHYFRDPTYCFDLPLLLNGTTFQKNVWSCLQRIPAGKTVHYGAIAETLESSARAVGNACRANPVPLIVPCHRVTAKQGIGGYSGHTEGTVLDVKKWLLRHEGVTVNGL